MGVCTVFSRYANTVSRCHMAYVKIKINGVAATTNLVLITDTSFKVPSKQIRPKSGQIVQLEQQS